VNISYFVQIEAERKLEGCSYIAPLEEHCHNSKNTTFQERERERERERNTGRGDAIGSKELRYFSPLAAILEKRRVGPFHWVDMVSGVPPVDITQNERFLGCDTVILVVRYMHCPFIVFSF
jgi:hypothetical protein